MPSAKKWQSETETNDRSLSFNTNQVTIRAQDYTPGRADFRSTS